MRRTARRVRPARHRLADQFDVVAGRASGRGGRRCSAPGVQAGRLFLLVRTTVRTPTQVLWCIRLIIGGAVGIATVAILQTLSIGPVLALLDTWWPIGPGGLGRARHGDALERDCHRRLHHDRPDAACHVRGPWPAW